MDQGSNATNRDQLQTLLAELKKAKRASITLSRKEFNRLVSQVTTLNVATEHALARQFKVGLCVIRDWQNVSAPHRFGRPSVITGLIQMVDSALNVRPHNISREISPSGCHGSGGGMVG